MLALSGTPGAAARPAIAETSESPGRDTGAVLRLTLVGARPEAPAEGREALPGSVNYLKGTDRRQWRSGIATYARVAYDDIYPGVDLVYYGSQRQLEYDFIVRPGADPRVITLEAEGADRIEVDASGDLVLHVVFVTKLDAAGATLTYSTFLGGSGQDLGQGVAVDATGSAYVTGRTSSNDFPTTVDAYDTSFNGNNDVFVTKLDATGATLAYSSESF